MKNHESLNRSNNMVEVVASLPLEEYKDVKILYVCLTNLLIDPFHKIVFRMDSLASLQYKSLFYFC